jgi:hypothetical protein
VNLTQIHFPNKFLARMVLKYPDDEEPVARTALQYWQYPTDYSVTTTDKLDSAPEPTNAIAVDAVTSAASHLAEQLINADRGPNALMNQLVCSVQSEEDFGPLRRRRCWQDAFQSVYNQWLDRIEAGDVNAYFYGTTCKQAILFRTSVVGGEVLPMIAFPCTTTKEF